MLDHRPIWKERLLACAVFGAITIGVVAASDTLITGGFDLPSVERGAHADTPNFFQTAALTWDSWAPRAEAQTVSWTDAAPIDAAATSYAEQDLAGGIDEHELALSAPSYSTPTEAELRREITALYEALPSAGDHEGLPEDDAYTADPVATHDGSETEADEVSAVDKTKLTASAYGSASPW